MHDSETLLPLAAAAGGGTIDGRPAPQLVAAGFTLLQRSPALVRALRGRRAALLLPSGPAFLTALAASDGRGAVLINPLAAPAEVAFQLADADVGATFTVRALAAKLPPGATHVLLDAAPAHATVVDAAGTTRVDLGSHFGMELEVGRDAEGRDEECAIVYTSAMAGTPLGAVLTHRNLLANARQTREAVAQERDDHVLALLPYSHLFGLTVTMTSPMLAGARVTTMARFNPIVAVDLLERDAVTEVTGVPAVYAALLQAIERRDGRIHVPQLRVALCGGAALDPALQDRWFDATGVELRQGYGLTESSPVCLFNRVSLPNARGTLGVAFPGCDVTIRDTDRSTPVPDGAEGEICVRGPTVFRGYLHRGADGLLVRDGWLHTGDRGVRDADGRIRFLGLIKSMFTRNGFNVYPHEVERVIGAMPGVTSVRVYPIPEPARENDVGVAIEGSVDEREVRTWCESRLAAYKQPSSIAVAPPRATA
jgi:long-chain acyl-CoA synthetase